MIKIEENGHTILAPEKIYVPTAGDELHYHMTCPNNEFQESIEYIRKDALVKYLSEEKGYPITLNGELVHWDELNKHLAEYNKWKKDAFIKKACDAYCKVCGHYPHSVPTHICRHDCDYFKDFKKYLEDSL